MQRHGDVEVERIIIGDAGDEEHEDEQDIVLETDISLLSAEFLSHYEAFEGDEGELGEGDQVARTGVMSGKEVRSLIGRN